MDARIGQRFSHYRVVERIDAGGTGENRSITHTGYHVGQIGVVAKLLPIV